MGYHKYKDGKGWYYRGYNPETDTYYTESSRKKKKQKKTKAKPKKGTPDTRRGSSYNSTYAPQYSTSLNWQAIELDYKRRVTAWLQEAHGYTIHKTGVGNGADILALTSNNIPVCFRCIYLDNFSYVGANAIQEIYVAKALYQCTGAVVITNTNFSLDARNLASSLGVRLMPNIDPVKTTYTKKRRTNWLIWIVIFLISLWLFFGNSIN